MIIRKVIPIFILVSLLLAACGENNPATSSDELQVVASTNIVGDVVSQVGGDLIDLTVLFPVGADPHTFEPRPQDVVVISEADVVIIHGLQLEETLESILESNVNGTLIHAAEGIETIAFEGDEDEGEHAHEDEDHEGEEERAHEDENHEGEEKHAEDEDEHAHEHEDGDPHTWTDPNNVIIWTQNIASALSEADPANAATYQANAEAYIYELRELDTWIRAQVETIPAEQRELVTDHATFGYFADEYGLNQAGFMSPSTSTAASPSAKELAELVHIIQEYGVPAIFVGTTVNPSLAEQVAQDTGAQVVFLYTGSLSEPDDEVDSYLAFMRYNVSTIVEALR